MGPSTPVNYYWPASRMLLPFIPAFILVPFAMLRPNRRLQAWAVLVPFCLITAVMIAGQQLPLVSIATAFAYAYPYVVMLASSLCLLCLISFAFPGWPAARKWLAIAVFGVLPGVLFLFFHAGSAYQFRVMAGVWGLAPLLLLASSVLSFRRCRTGWHLGRFTPWFLLWNFLLLTMVVLAFAGILVATDPPPVSWWTILLPIPVLVLVIEFILFLISYPFVLIAFMNSEYRERLMAIFHIEGAQPGPPATHAISGEIPTEPRVQASG